MGCIDIYTIGRKDRMIGNYMFTCDVLGEKVKKSHGEGSDSNYSDIIVGFENHSGATFLGDDVKPLGHILSGYGNNGEDGEEGAVYKNVYCTYSHGPLLPKNPTFCDYLLETALNRKYGQNEKIILPPLDNDYENKAHAVMEQRMSGGKKDRRENSL